MFRVNCVEIHDCTSVDVEAVDSLVYFSYTNDMESMVFEVPFDDIKTASDEGENLIVQGEDTYWLYLDVNDCDELDGKCDDALTEQEFLDGIEEPEQIDLKDVIGLFEEEE